MPVEPVELLKLIIGLIILTIPGYLYGYLFSVQLTHMERILFGFLCGLAFLTITTFALNFLLNIKITQTIVWLLYIFYFIPIAVIFLISILGSKFQKINLNFFKNKTVIILIFILCFSFFMMFLPHLVNDYLLPFHVDEWIHWSYTRSVIEQGSTSFIDPYTGNGIITSPEIGFHISGTILHFISTSSLQTIFLFMPAILGVFLSLVAFVIGQRSQRQFGLEAAFLVAFIPTTVRSLGPSFFTPSTLSLVFLLFLIWLVQLKKIQGIILIPFFIFYIFLIYPVTALAVVGILVVYALFLLIKKEYRYALYIGVLTVIPILIIVLLASRWNNLVDWFLTSMSGQQYMLDLHLSKISISFTDLGLLTWGLLIIGVAYSFIKEKTLLRTLSLSIIAFIIIIGLYDKFDYGFPSIYERIFLYLFLLVALVAGFGLSEIRRILSDILKKKKYQHIRTRIKNLPLIISVILAIIILVIGVNAHLDTPYYEMITEEEYETFSWIHDNIGNYQDAYHSYNRAAVNPYKASPFSAVTGLYTISSNMNPIYGYELVDNMKTFLREKCTNTSFLDKYQISVIYGVANNSNLTMIYDNVYLYPGLSE